MRLFNNQTILERLTRAEAAAYLGVNAQTLANWAHTGKVGIPHHKVGRKVIYMKSDLDNYLAANRRTQTA
ncbi:TPA: helix-turn-helix domain-containing protein [Klebsiella pneumoniae]|jgi:excisionase family DNA binding protein|uniref:helix-turn-helix domain-containing protein n=1 Tax=Enterobacteriaceae TaxID=543 RepID=UPI00094186F8|nr:MULTISPECIES: helix-turn-helix domain-containing protein [Klebsiella]HEH6361481.1 helix-turn-helix domain-containing protein [Raoultella planticola]MCI7894026.1 helix-turn-helix domain-containing protein [Klebsiella pneumoniae]MDV0851046.1 helix-turn-helix domain-containing protein [Klebsiella quasipneumoniae subsp. similipneumoniae]MDV0885923.1 helix-turn-helix domain-containing protein [Klebsiella quasipneumoniae subsp. similipneumoniae]PXG93932.1 DNA-binding protein [Klebsiella pneumonia